MHIPSTFSSDASSDPAVAPDRAAPLFARIEAELRQRIQRGDLPAGGKLPSEAELERAFGVSRITVRQALAALEAGGLIHKVNGKGSFVTQASDAPRLGPLTGFYEHMRKLGRDARGRLVSVRRVRARAAHAAALDLPEGSELSAATVVRLVDGRPLAVGTLYGPHAIVQALVEADLETNDSMTLLEAHLGHRLKFSQIEASALRAGALRARQLGIAPDDPVLRVDFTPHDIDGRPLIHSEMYFRGDAFRYRATIKR